MFGKGKAKIWEEWVAGVLHCSSKSSVPPSGDLDHQRNPKDRAVLTAKVITVNGTSSPLCCSALLLAWQFSQHSWAPRCLLCTEGVAQ